MKALGPTQIAILRACADGKRFTCSRPGEYMSALKLAARGLVDRDLRRGASHQFVGNTAGTAAFNAYEADLARSS